MASSTPQNRINKIVRQIAPAPTASNASSTPHKANDVVIVSALRTPITKARGGKFVNTYVEELLAATIKATIEKTKINPASIDDIVVGTVLGNGSQRANECRMGAFLAGIPETVPIHTVNRQCSSGLQAIAHVAANIKAGYYDIGLAAGLESMSSSKFAWEGSLNPKLQANEKAKACLIPMGVTSENVAKKYNVSRKEQDELAVLSHARAAAAIKSGRFKDEIIPVETVLKDAATNTERKIVVDTDDGVRPGTTLENLSKLPGVFKKDGTGTTTAGNASQVSDGAAAVLLMRRSVADKLGLPVLGIFRSFAAVGVDPAIMGVGPAEAIPVAVQKAGLTMDQIDLFEINEAFASQAAYSVKKLKISWDKVNVNGGAIALGHPLGCTGARMSATLLHEMAKRKSKYGVVSMCIGSGMGAAAVFERE